jgi:drug/metabolite transporter (DMT)-like permease
VSAALALISSLFWGSADFLAGNLSKRYAAIAVTGVSQAFGLLVGVLIASAGHSFFMPTLHWSSYLLPGVCAGFAGFLGLVSYYSGLATGRMGVVAPISSLSAAIPLIYSIVRGERPTTIQIVGISIALLGAFCASGPELVKGLPIKPMLFGTGAALGFGIALTFMAQGSKSSPIMTMVTMRVATVSVCLLLALRIKSIGGFKRSSVAILIIIGAMDFLANYFLGVATTKGLVSVAMILGSLFPITTVLLAYKFLHERLHQVQYFGVFCAVLGVALISL